MQHWSLDTTPAQQAADRAVDGLIGALGRPGFAAEALAQLHSATGVGSWAVYQVGPGRAPLMHLSAALGGADTTERCFATYRDSGLHARDRSFDPVRAADARQRPLLLRLHADDAAPAHRDAIYRANGMVERLSVARAEADGSVLAVNVYRHSDRGGFDGASVDAFARLAGPLLATVARQIRWRLEQAPGDRRSQLRRHCATLTERELDVLERLLQGMTYDGIAADMGLSVATVKTYRARAFERLDIHFKNELFALVMGYPPSA